MFASQLLKPILLALQIRLLIMLPLVPTLYGFRELITSLLHPDISLKALYGSGSDIVYQRST